MSGLLWRGMPYRLLAETHRRNDMLLYSSGVLLTELAGVLTRPSAAERLGILGKTALEVLADYIESVELVEPVEVPRVVPDDADDDHVIAAAVAADAGLIVSGDSDLLNLGSHQGIKSCSVAKAFELLGG